MGSGLIGVSGAIIRRPDLWLTGARQLVAMTPKRWWAHRPFLPVPDRDYRRFRALTQYGDAGHGLVPGDVISWLDWCREHRRVTGVRRGHG